MKKMIAFCLIMTVVLSMVACGQQDPSVETTTTNTTPIATEQGNPTPEVADTTPQSSSAEELLASEATVTLDNGEATDYWEALLDLGYSELWAYETRGDIPKTYTLHSLTYNDAAFKLTLTAIDDTTGQHYEDFILYGMKSDSLRNITDIDLESYQNVTVEDESMNPLAVPLSIAQKLGEENIPLLQKTTDCSNVDVSNMKETDDGFFEGTIIMHNVYHVSFYYPATGNLYNFVRESVDEYKSEDFMGNEYTGPINYWPNFPQNLLKEWRVVLEESWAREGALKCETMHWTLANDSVYTIYFEPDMDYEDWANSKYNIDGWTWVDVEKEGIHEWLVSPDQKWVLAQTYSAETIGQRKTIAESIDNGTLMLASMDEAREMHGYSLCNGCISVGYARIIEY